MNPEVDLERLKLDLSAELTALFERILVAAFSRAATEQMALRDEAILSGEVFVKTSLMIANVGNEFRTIAQAYAARLIAAGDPNASYDRDLDRLRTYLNDLVRQTEIDMGQA